jgi:hypothetical protein
MRISRKWISMACAVIVALVSIVSPLEGTRPSPALANGAPVTVFLSYLPKFSNYGPVNAKGTADISIGEAWLELEAEGMPRLKDALYEVWITNAATKERISLGKFNADAKGLVAFRANFQDLPKADYRYLFVSVEPLPDPSPEPDKRVTIAGVFPNAQLLIVTGTPTPALVPGVTPPPAPPAVLPVTGGGVVDSWAVLGCLLLAALTLALMTVVHRQRTPQQAHTNSKEEPVSHAPGGHGNFAARAHVGPVGMGASHDTGAGDGETHESQG